MSNKQRLWLTLMIFFSVAFSISGCLKQEPVRIGFVADLTGKQAELGVQERNGVQLAIERYNAASGINGRPVELLIRDDLGSAEGAKKAARELIDAGAVAVIGHATSAQTIAGLKITEAAQLILISPTASSPDLSGSSEYFFRVYPTFRESAQAFASYISAQRKLQRIAVIYDRDNAAYSKTYRNVFIEKYLSSGGSLVKEVDFSSAAQPDFTPLLSDMRRNNPDCVLIIASDIDTALIAQRIRLLGWKTALFTSAWAQTETLLQSGGLAVEDMELEQSYALESDAPLFSSFKQQYRERFGRMPSFGAAFGYEAAGILLKALEQNGGKRAGLRQELLKIRDFQGLMTTFSFAANGDVIRPFYLSKIKGGRFIILSTLTTP